MPETPSDASEGEFLEHTESESPIELKATAPEESEKFPEVDQSSLADEVDSEEVEVEEIVQSADGGVETVIRRVRRKRRQARPDAAELRLKGRHSLCKSIADIAPLMLKTVKLRVLGRHLPSTRGLEDDGLTQIIKKDATKLAERNRVLAALQTFDPDVNRQHLKAIVLFRILLQEETYSLEETRLDEKVIEFEKELVKQAKTLDFFDVKRHDADRCHHYDTYRIVLEAAWRNDEGISPDEARLLAVLRERLNISLDEHWLIGAHIRRFPKPKCVLHLPDDINEARKELQREGLLWSYRDETNRNIDVIPREIVGFIRGEAQQELQYVNYRRLLRHDSILLNDLRNVLHYRSMDRSGNKPDLIERIVFSRIRPSEVLESLDRQKLSEMCNHVGLRFSGNKPDLIERLISFYDDLTFEERQTKDDREIWYGNYELLAARQYADLRAKKLIVKDIEIEHAFERATEFLFEVKLNVACDVSRKDSRADGRLPLDNNQSLLWDCKSCEAPVNLQDFLESQFEGYLRKETTTGRQPLAFLVIGPSFTDPSIKLAHQFKARTNWDVALVTADGLKHLAERWSATEPKKVFPIRLLNRTELIDRERAEFLLSLA